MESFKASCHFADVLNPYCNPTEEPHKPGSKEKRKKAASFQTVSQLHKVRANPSCVAMRDLCTEHPSTSPTPLPELQAILHMSSSVLKDHKGSRELSWLGKSSWHLLLGPVPGRVPALSPCC